MRGVGRCASPGVRGCGLTMELPSSQQGMQEWKRKWNLHLRVKGRQCWNGEKITTNMIRIL